MAEREVLILGPSSASREFESRLERVAGSDATVLIEGESGTGKSSAAHALHERSPRAQGPFVPVPLAALAPTLIESELFGHEEGAFTGAATRREGRFRRAHGGTLLLDGVDALPLEVQVKLLRVLQERKVEPVGSEEEIEIDVRVLATSTGSLSNAVEEGRFREDLYFRLAVVVLEVPPLRSRLEDLDSLIAQLTARIAERSGVGQRQLSTAAAERLAKHSWPGNVRELENALERVLVLPHKTADEIQVEEFAFLEEARLGEVDRLAQRALALGFTLGDLEQAMLAAALREQRGVVSAAARQVGLTRKAFDYRLDKSTEAES